MRRFLHGAWVVGLALVAWHGPLAAQSIPVSVGGSASSLVGMDLDLPIEVDLSARPEKLGSFALRLQWDPSVLQFVGGVNGDFGSIQVNEDETGTGILRLSGANPAGASGHVVIGWARMRPLIAGNSILQLQVDELYAAGVFTDLLPSVVVPSKTYCPALGRAGDLNRDDAVAALDAQITLMAAVGLDLPAGTQAAVGDLDGNGETNTRDALIILSRVVGLDVTPFEFLRVVPGACAQQAFFQMALAPGDQAVVAGQTINYFPRATDGSTRPVSLPGLLWSSSNETVATVDGAGEVTTLTPGTAVITVTETGGRQASAILDVLPGRPMHWVDALAANASNRLGSAALPFSRIQDAVDFAQPGDTVAIRSGRYAEYVEVGKRLALVGKVTSPAGPPVISEPAEYYGETSDGGVTIYGSGTGTGQVLLRGLRFDSIYQAVSVYDGDTVAIEDVDFAVSTWSDGAVYVDTAAALLVQRSRFRGSRSGEYSTNAIYLSRGADLVSIDSTLVSDFTDDALSLYGVDSLAVQHSTFQHNQYFGIYAYVAGVHRAAFIHENRFQGNEGGNVYLDGFARTRLEHNVTVGASYQYGFEFWGDGTSQLAIIGDSAQITQAYWLRTHNVDSIFVDSVAVRGGGPGQLESGRALVVQNSRFDELTSGTGITFYPVSTGTVRIRNVGFAGAPSCDRCASALYSQYAGLDADSLFLKNLYYGIQTYDAPARIRRADIQDVYAGISAACGRVEVDTSAFARVDGYAVERYSYACGGTDSVLVTDVTMADVRAGVSVEEIPTVIRRLTGTNLLNAADVSGPLLVQNSSFAMGPTGNSDTFLYANGSNYADSLVVENSTFSCGSDGNQGGMYLSYGQVRVSNNILQQCSTSIATYGDGMGVPMGVVIEQNQVAVGGYLGISVDGSSASSRIVKNILDGSAYYSSIAVGNTGATPQFSAWVDSNTVSRSTGSGILARGVDTLFVRGNTLTNHLGGAPTGTYNGAIVLAGGNGATTSAELWANRITGSKSNGIVLARQPGDTLVVTVDSNTVKNVDSMAVWVRDYARALLTYNALDGSRIDGVHISSSLVAAPAVTADNNSFTGNAQFGVRNITGITVQALNNWWNGDGGPRCDTCALGNGDSVSVDVAYNPFLTAPPAEVPAPVAPLFAAMAYRAAALPAAGTVSAKLAPGAAAVVARAPMTAAPAPAATVVTRPPKKARQVSDRPAARALAAGDRLRAAATERRATVARESAAVHLARRSALAERINQWHQARRERREAAITRNRP